MPVRSQKNPLQAQCLPTAPVAVQRQSLGPPVADAYATLVQQSPQTQHIAQLQAIANGAPATLQRKPNEGGLPDQLRSGIESLSGMSMDGVQVHYNSSKPAQLQAHAFAQGRDIHLAPGQEKHLPHEAWHVVQQAQGRVKPTLQLKGVAINDDNALEQEADAMGAKAIAQRQSYTVMPAEGVPNPMVATQRMATAVIQRVKTNPAYNTLTLRQKLEQFYDYTYLYAFNPRPAALKTLDTDIGALDKAHLNAGLMTDNYIRQVRNIWAQLHNYYISEIPAVGDQKKIDRKAHVGLLRDELLGLLQQDMTSQHQMIGAKSNTARQTDISALTTAEYTTHVNTLESHADTKTMDLPLTGDWMAGMLRQNHRLPFDHLARHQREAVEHIVLGGYGPVNDALRSQTNDPRDQDHVLMARNIVSALGSMSKSAGEAERYCTHFPNNSQDPASLVPNQIYRDRAFFFVGEERPSDAGFRMAIEFTNGYYIPDTVGRRIYGQAKDQYILLPNTPLQYIGVENVTGGVRYRFREV
jgi:hypothetical protein